MRRKIQLLLAERAASGEVANRPMAPQGAMVYNPTIGGDFKKISNRADLVGDAAAPEGALRQLPDGRLYQMEGGRFMQVAGSMELERQPGSKYLTYAAGHPSQTRELAWERGIRDQATQDIESQTAASVAEFEEWRTLAGQNYSRMTDRGKALYSSLDQKAAALQEAAQKQRLTRTELLREMGRLSDEARAIQWEGHVVQNGDQIGDLVEDGDIIRVRTEKGLEPLSYTTDYISKNAKPIPGTNSILLPPNPRTGQHEVVSANPRDPANEDAMTRSIEADIAKEFDSLRDGWETQNGSLADAPNGEDIAIKLRDMASKIVVSRRQQARNAYKEIFDLGTPTHNESMPGASLNPIGKRADTIRSQEEEAVRQQQAAANAQIQQMQLVQAAQARKVSKDLAIQSVRGMAGGQWLERIASGEPTAIVQDLSRVLKDADAETIQKLGQFENAEDALEQSLIRWQEFPSLSYKVQQRTQVSSEKDMEGVDIGSVVETPNRGLYYKLGPGRFILMGRRPTQEPYAEQMGQLQAAF